jgi:hypothetical protein
MLGDRGEHRHAVCVHDRVGRSDGSTPNAAKRARGFRVPGGAWVPMIAIGLCLLLMMALPLETWVRFLSGC